MNALIGKEVFLWPIPGFQMITHGLKSALFSKGVRILLLLVLISLYLDLLWLSASTLSNDYLSMQQIGSSLFNRLLDVKASHQWQRVLKSSTWYWSGRPLELLVSSVIPCGSCPIQMLLIYYDDNFTVRYFWIELYSPLYDYNLCIFINYSVIQ